MTTKNEVFIPPRNKSDMTGHLKNLIENKRVSIYIDSANLYFASSIAKIKIDFIHLSKWFRANCKLTGINFYSAYDPDEPKQLDFLQELTEAGYRIVKKPVKIFENSKKGNMDIELAVDCLTQKDLYDIVILLSGDGDFSYLIQALDSVGKDTIILGIGGFTSYELHQEASNYFFLNRIMDVWSPRKKKGKKKKISTPQMPLKTDVLNKEDKPVESEVKTSLKAIAKTNSANPSKITKLLDPKEKLKKLKGTTPKKLTTKAKPTLQKSNHIKKLTTKKKVTKEQPKKSSPKVTKKQSPAKKTSSSNKEPKIFL